MAEPFEIGRAIADQLDSIPGLRVFDHPPQGITPPIAFVVLNTATPDTMGRNNHHTLRYQVFLFTAESVRPVDGYRDLLKYCGFTETESVRKAVWDGNTPGAGTFVGLADTSASVDGFEVLGSEQIDAYQAYGGVFDVEVHTKGT